jgi:hypothetical protein
VLLLAEHRDSHVSNSVAAGTLFVDKVDEPPSHGFCINCCEAGDCTF